MTSLGRSVLALGAVLAVAPAAPARAQFVVATTETLDFDRPESWGMKYYASLALLTSMGVPEKRAGGTIDLGFEGSYVPQMSDESAASASTARSSKTSTRRASSAASAAAWVSARAWRSSSPTRRRSRWAAPSRTSSRWRWGGPSSSRPSWRLGVRGYGQIGTIEADITCSADEAAAGDDLQQNPFQCVEPSEDESHQKVIGLELVAGYDGASRFKPYVGLGLNYMDLEFDVNAVYADGLRRGPQRPAHERHHRLRDRGADLRGRASAGASRPSSSTPGSRSPGPRRPRRPTRASSTPGPS